jgi:hypothetical protein
MTRWKSSDGIPRRIGTLPVFLILIAGVGFGARAAEEASSPGDTLDLTRAVVVAPEDLSGPEKKAVAMLLEEVGRRSGVRWEVTPTVPDDAPVIAVGQGPALRAKAPRFGGWLARGPVPGGAEGYRILTEGEDRAVLVVGNDPRGVLFGIGRLLRELRMTRGRVLLPAGLQLATAPRYPLRGHQLGYRPKRRSWGGPRRIRSPRSGGPGSTSLPRRCSRASACN